MVALSAIPAEPLHRIKAPVAEAAVQRSGRWKPHRSAESPLRRWSLQLRRRSGGEVRGRLLLLGSPLANAGDLAARIEGERVSGEITGPRGEVIARFEGRVSDEQMQGTYRDRTGETGTWVWDDDVLP
jgi:hypothetical protein